MQQHSLVWQQGKLARNASAKALKDQLRDPRALIWYDIQGDPHQAAAVFTETFQLRPITLDSICEKRERAKFVESANYYYVVVHGLIFDAQKEESHTPKLDIVFGQNFVITAHYDALPWLDELRAAARNDPSEENLLGRGMPHLLYTILDTLVDTYFPVLDTIDGIIDELEYSTVNVASDAVQARIFRMKRGLALMRRVISPQVEVTNAIRSRTGEVIPAEAEPYFSDVHDHLIRAFEVLDSYRDLMSGLLDVYLSTVSNRLNQVMKQLTIIATIFMPITFITGVFGQNFGHSPQVEHDGGYNFWIVLLAMGLITAGQIWYFRRREWL